MFRMSKNVNVRFFLQRVLAAAVFILALWIFYSKIVSDKTVYEMESFRNPSIAITTLKPVSNNEEKFLYFCNFIDRLLV